MANDDDNKAVYECARCESFFVALNERDVKKTRTAWKADVNASMMVHDHRYLCDSCYAYLIEAGLKKL